MLQDVIRQFQEGTLSPDDFWMEMSARHQSLYEYSALIQRSPLIAALEIQSEALVIRLVNGLRFMWNPNDTRTALSYLINHGEYETSEMNLLLRAAEKAQTIVDVGANMGWYTLHFAQKVHAKHGKVCCFEPVPTTYELLSSNTALNPQFQECIKIEPFGLSKAAGEITLFIPKISGSVAASQRVLYPDDDNREVTGKVIRLDDYAAEHNLPPIDLLKVDVEGAEKLVLEGAMERIQSDQPVIMLEMLRKWAALYDYHPNDLLALLKPLGYRCWYQLDDTYIELVEMTDGTEERNFFFLHMDRHGLPQTYFGA